MATGNNTENPQSSVTGSTSSPKTTPDTPNTSSKSSSSPPIPRADLPHASDFLAFVQAPENVQKLKDLQCRSVKEFQELAEDDCDLWKLDEVSGNYVFNEFDYKKQFEPFGDSILEDISTWVQKDFPTDQLPDFSKILVYGDGPRNEAAIPALILQTECSRETVVVPMDQIDVVNLFMDVQVIDETFARKRGLHHSTGTMLNHNIYNSQKEWSRCFYDNVNKAEMLYFIWDGESDYDGALLLVSAEFNFPSPLVETRKCYFLRACYYNIYCESWFVVDFSLDSIFPNPSARYIKRPSGIMIEADENEDYSRITWVEHVEVDTSTVHNLFKPLVTSGYGFGAARWVSSFTRHLARVSLYPDGAIVDVITEGKKRLLRLAERMTKIFIFGISASSENTWDPIHIPGSEDILVQTKYNVNDPGSPRGVIVTVATTIWLPKQPGQVLDFLKEASNRHKWDILSLNRPRQALVTISIDTDPRGGVSIIPFIPPMPVDVILQEVKVGTTATYIVYAPVDMYSLYSVLQGQDSSEVKILSSGFVVMPDREPIKGEDIGGTLLTISFQIADNEHATVDDILADGSVAAFHRIVTGTVYLIKAAMEEGGN